MQTIKITSKEEFIKYNNILKTEAGEKTKYLSNITKAKGEWYYPGFCETCEEESVFLVDWLYSDQKTPNYRERFVCRKCGLNSRQRFITGYAKKLDIPRAINAYLYEQTTSFYKCFEKFDQFKITGSEYLGYDIKPGSILNGIRHEDALNLSFSDSSFDVIISNDVLEHVPDVHVALKEAHRVLKNNGFLIFTIPFHKYEDKTIRRSLLNNGELSHLLPEQYHGNPVSSKGSLVFYDFGWDILDFCKEAGFKEAYIVAYHSFYRAYIAEEFQLGFAAEKQSK